MTRFDPGDVRHYYDRQTRGFVALGQGGSEGAIHRAVWGPGVTTRVQAFHFVEDRIAEWLAVECDRSGPGAAAPHVVDLGCGIGGSLIHLAGRIPLRGTGITLSGVQAHMATEWIRERGLSDRLSCVQGDYTRLPPALAPADLAFAIESFVHGPSPGQFFAECARVIRPGGALVVCDDVRRPTSDPLAKRAVERFCGGWRVNSLLSREELHAAARAAGFVHVETRDLTPWLELGRPRDRALGAFVALFGWLPLERTRFGHVVGGTALQTCLSRGWIGYDLIRFRRDR